MYIVQYLGALVRVRTLHFGSHPKNTKPNMLRVRENLLNKMYF